MQSDRSEGGEITQSPTVLPCVLCVLSEAHDGKKSAADCLGSKAKILQIKEERESKDDSALFCQKRRAWTKWRKIIPTYLLLQSQLCLFFFFVITIRAIINTTETNLGQDLKA